MIVSKDITLKLDSPITNAQIESKLNELNLNVIRWAITDTVGNGFIVRISLLID